MCGLRLFKVLMEDPKTLGKDELMLVAMLLELKDVHDTEASRTELIKFQAKMGQIVFPPQDNAEQAHQNNPS